jgi:hypothetical protein
MAFEVDAPKSDVSEETILFADGSSSETVQLNRGNVEGARPAQSAPPDDTVLFDDRDGERVPQTPPTVIGSDSGGATRSTPEAERTGPIERQPTFEVPSDLPTSWDHKAAREAALTQPLLVSLVFALIAYVLVAFPLTVSTRNTLREESLDRGRSLLRLLEASNSLQLATQRIEDLSVAMVVGEPGVQDALILDPEGRILVPPERAGGLLDILEGIDQPVHEIGGLVVGENESGDFNMAMPISSGGRRVGAAALTFSLPRQAKGGTLMILLLVGLLLILIGTASAILLTKKRLRALSAVASEPTIAELP